ncbi:MAG TPA: AIM24 family protein [Chthonomonadaceae bacterium]|nr:AIM24 family protein [Chthonomonadaceae bacterium]
MQHTVIGTANQCVVAQMTVGEEVRGEAAALLLLSDGVALEAPAHAPRPLLPEIGSAVPLTHFRCMASLGVVTFGAPCVGEIRKIEIRGSAWMCARDSFLFCTQDLHAAIGMAQPVVSGYFRQGGFILYRLSGHGDAYIHCGGNVIEYDLAAGQRVSVDPGCVAAYEESVQPAVETLEVTPGSGPLYLMTLTGPGRIYLATLPLARIHNHEERRH